MLSVLVQFLGHVFFDTTPKGHSKSDLCDEINHTDLLDESDTVEHIRKYGYDIDCRVLD